MSEFELKIESQPLFVVNVLPTADPSLDSPFFLSVDTSAMNMFTLTIGELGSSGSLGLPNSIDDVFNTTATEAISALRLVALTSGGVELVNPSSIDSLMRMVGISINAASTDSAIAIRRSGIMSDPVWTWIPGQLLFCGATGVLTTSAPTSIASRQVGVAVDPTTILINFSDLIVLE